MKLAVATLLPLYAAAFAPSAQKSNGLSTITSINTSPSIVNGINNKMSQLQAAMVAEELPLYVPQQKEIPKVLGGIKIGLRKLTVITGASSGLGLSTATALVNSGRHFVVMACRDVEKGKKGTVFIFLWVFNMHIQYSNIAFYTSLKVERNKHHLKGG